MFIVCINITIDTARATTMQMSTLGRTRWTGAQNECSLCCRIQQFLFLLQRGTVSQSLRWQLPPLSKSINTAAYFKGKGKLDSKKCIQSRVIKTSHSGPHHIQAAMNFPRHLTNKLKSALFTHHFLEISYALWIGFRWDYSEKSVRMRRGRKKQQEDL